MRQPRPPVVRRLTLTFAIAAVSGALLMMGSSLGAARNSRGEFAGLGIVYLLGTAGAAMTAVGVLLTIRSSTRDDGFMLIAGGVGGWTGMYCAVWTLLR